MASALQGSSLAEDLLCPICLSLFRDPRVLACGHSFCAPCLEPCVPMGLCPKCRRPFTLSSVAVNWALSSLAEKARLLRLDEEAQPGGGGPGWAICTEHEEPLKLFCRQDEELVCVICRDLPQHWGHDFLPLKNAVQACQDKLRASLVPLRERLNSATGNQRRQQENIAELESCVQDLSDYISKEFEVLHQILHEKEEGMKQEVERMKKENREEMEEKLKELDEEVTSCSQTLSRVQAGLDTADHTAFLRGIKELMRSVREEDRDDEGCSGDEDEDVANGEEAEEEEEEDRDDEGCSGDEYEDVTNGEEAEEKEEEDRDDEGCSGDEDEDVADGEGEEAEEEEEEDSDEEDEEDWNIVAVDSSLEAFKDLLDFEAWQTMLETIQAGPAHEGI